ncbi:hypothetical protein ASE25_17390 [Terrabacter sp. Root85]|uniref:MauE/DoxX family redox-associated membrane protein n=1 Tax=Terrabacter sp. Root85 TaxID=1736603 RepID=UPI0006F247A0|nr:MauE/DoxX family redox-associated membrane protein [Terrabacter sp. Root85]KRC87499.1 hypothetical protein ASE25_17390 [Terrabacter sp. Root85]
MPSDALALAPVILAVVLVVSAVGKLRSPSASAEAFRDLRVPAPLRGRVVVEGLPWGELLLAALLVLVGGPVGIVAAVAALLLFTAYLGLVVRALGFDEDVDCACFGEFAPGRITRRTVVRNAWLVLLAVLAVVVAAQGSSVAARVADDRLPWWWLVGAGVAAATTYLIVGAPSPAAPAAGDVPDDESGDYLRTRTPAVPVSLSDGSTTNLRALSVERPQLLVYVSEMCGSCEEVITSVPEWRTRLPLLDVRLVTRMAAGHTHLTSLEEPLTVHDTEGAFSDTFGLATPSALLLGVDGHLAGGPVTGSLAVPEFVADIEAELAAVTAPEMDPSDAAR